MLYGSVELAVMARVPSLAVELLEAHCAVNLRKTLVGQQSSSAQARSADRASLSMV